MQVARQILYCSGVAYLLPVEAAIGRFRHQYCHSVSHRCHRGDVEIPAIVDLHAFAEISRVRQAGHDHFAKGGATILADADMRGGIGEMVVDDYYRAAKRGAGGLILYAQAAIQSQVVGQHILVYGGGGLSTLSGTITGKTSCSPSFSSSAKYCCTEREN